MTRMFGRYVPVEMAVLGLLEALLCFGAFYATLTATGTSNLPLLGLNAGLATHSAQLAGIIALCAVAIGLYRPEVCLDRRRLVLNAAAAAVLAFPAALMVGRQFDDGFSRTYAVALIKVLVIWMAFAVASRSLVSVALRSLVLRRRVLVIGGGPAAIVTATALRAGRGRVFELAGPETDRAGLDDLTPQALRRRNVWGVVVAAEDLDTASPEAHHALIDCRLRGIRVYDDTSFWEQHLGRVNLGRLHVGWFLSGDGFSQGRLSLAIKRVIDIVVSVALLVATFPLMLATAIAIKLDSPGSVLYRQERVGLHGRPFTLMKFRSMQADAEAPGKPRWATPRDPRVTRVGAVIRQTRLDELPQLINVLRGEMSLIGPRPERPHFIEQLAAVIPFYNERSYVKPGVTGWAQVNYPYGASIEDAREKLSYDLYYVKNRSAFLDLAILIRTVRVVLFREGAR